MVGDPGPYTNDDGDVWVPRTVPYPEARRVAREAQGWFDRLVYIGKGDADLLGFTMSCLCEEYCERRFDEQGDFPCRVPAWHFRLEER